MNNKKLVVIFSLLVCSLICFSLQAQEKWSVKLSYGQNNGTAKEYKDLVRNNSNLFHLRLQADYNIFNNLYGGVYLGYSKLRKPEMFNDGTEDNPILTYSFARTKALYYGINLNYQLLPLFTGKSNLRFELYPTVKFGLVSEFWKEAAENTPTSPLIKHTNTEFEFGIGLGAGYKFTKNFGIFGEGTFGKFYNDQSFRFHVGAQFNF